MHRCIVTPLLPGPRIFLSRCREVLRVGYPGRGVPISIQSCSHHKTVWEIVAAAALPWLTYSAVLNQSFLLLGVLSDQTIDTHLPVWLGFLWPDALPAANHSSKRWPSLCY